MTSTVDAGLRITMRLAQGSVVIGVEQAGCDPVFSTVPTGELHEALEHVEPTVLRAREVWGARRQGRAYVAPTPPPAPPRPQPTAAPRARRAGGQQAPAPSQPTQQSMM